MQKIETIKKSYQLTRVRRPGIVNDYSKRLNFKSIMIRLLERVSLSQGVWLKQTVCLKPYERSSIDFYEGPAAQRNQVAMYVPLIGILVYERESKRPKSSGHPSNFEAADVITLEKIHPRNDGFRLPQASVLL